MQTRVPYLLRTSALTVWSAVLLYFCFSNRLGYFLAPTFRHLVWFAAFTLVVISLCYAVFARPGARSPELECEHHHEENPQVQITSFVVLVLPVCLALFITPDAYSKLAYDNRGVDPTPPPPAPEMALWEDDPAGASTDVQAPSIDPAYADVIAADDGRPDPTPTPANSAPVADPALPGTVAMAAPQDTTAQMKAIVDQMEKDEKGYIKVETTDLSYAADEPGLRKALQGRKVVLLGQFYPSNGSGAQQLALSQGLETDPAEIKKNGAHYFWAVRMTMVCCAADARPCAVKIDRTTVPPAKAKTSFKDMDWVQARGIADFRRVPPSDQYPDLHFEPWLKAETIKPAATPAEIYLY